MSKSSSKVLYGELNEEVLVSASGVVAEGRLQVQTAVGRAGSNGGLEAREV